MASHVVCEICKFSDTNILDLGEWLTFEDCTIHLFCALLSTNSVQNGDDDTELAGFLVKDIRDLVEKHNNTKCYYCKGIGATVRCKTKKCGRFFHVICGVQHGCLFIFKDDFRTYCHRHVAITEKYKKHNAAWKCQICFDPMGEYNKITSIPSCCDQGYFHKKCMQQNVRTAGLVAKCPCCGNAEDEKGKKYLHFLQQRGIYCPEKDADWERTGAYKDIEGLTYKCVAEICRCPKGRNYYDEEGQWLVDRCRYCGDSGNHVACRVSNINETFECSDCRHKTLISVQTTSTNKNTTRSEAINDKPKTTIQRRKRRHEFESDENKVWKLVKTDLLPFRNTSFMLTTLDEKVHVDPLCREQEEEMRQARLKLFIDKADFSAKPPPFPWLA
ncbi:PHD finger protein 7-like [Contarinia nasturtii]|uniref:PHD finger protein 7-like n=1 Tax=Contarinia nasturtii TaxID=265458 RepID=UPI0012D459BB|nr:PHD finger protein 7-like [Contarinia nasturtii]